MLGRRAGCGRPSREPRGPEHQLLAAIILRALADALAGDIEAANWMDYFAPDIAYLWLGIEPEVIANWRRVAPLWQATSPAFCSALRYSVVYGRRDTQPRRRRRPL